MSETVQKKFKSEAERQNDEEIERLEANMQQFQTRRKAEQDQEVKLGELLKSTREAINSMGSETRYLSSTMLGPLDEICRINEQLALQRVQIAKLRETELSRKIDDRKWRKKQYLAMDTALEMRIATENANDARTKEQNETERIQQKAQQEVYLEEKRAAEKKEREEHEKVRGIMDKLKGKKS